MTLDDVDREAVLTAFAGDAASRAERVGQLVELLRANPGARDAFASLEFEAHAVKGAAATVGLEEIVDAANELEREAASWNPSSPEPPEAIVAQGELLVQLLRAFRPGPPPDATEPGERESGSAVVLHIEDNPSNLKLVERIFDRRPGVELQEAHTGNEGLALAATVRPTLIVLDLRLPDISGEEVLRRLRADTATRGIPVIVVSAEARPAEADRVLAAGADDFLVKPIDVTTFLEVVDRMLARARR